MLKLVKACWRINLFWLDSNSQKLNLKIIITLHRHKFQEDCSFVSLVSVIPSYQLPKVIGRERHILQYWFLCLKSMRSVFLYSTIFSNFSLSYIQIFSFKVFFVTCVSSAGKNKQTKPTLAELAENPSSVNKQTKPTMTELAENQLSASILSLYFLSG